jgi:D-alanyl-D-alanine carboxypeptidase
MDAKAGWAFMAQSILADITVSMPGIFKTVPHFRHLNAARYCVVLPLFLLILVFAPPNPAKASKYASIVIEEGSGRVLFSRNADQLRYPASLTKIMTLYLLFEDLEAGRLSLKSLIPVSKRAADRSPSKLYLKPGQSISAEQAIYALIIKSANDVATAIAEKLSGNERNFAKRMTRKAKSLGMTRTTFMNASGLPNRRQRSTARDMSVLAVAIRRDFPQFYGYFSTESFSWNGRRFKNHNSLLSSYSGTDGIKTGYIGASGFNLVAAVERNGMRLIGVVFGGKTSLSRDRHMKYILDKQFKRAKTIDFRQVALPMPEALPISPPPRGETGSEPPSADMKTAGTLPILASRPQQLLWSVQIGNFAQRVAAHRAAIKARRMVDDVLHMIPANLLLVSNGNMPLWRVRFNNLDEESARAACAVLFSAGSPCIAVRNGDDNLQG